MVDMLRGPVRETVRERLRRRYRTYGEVLAQPRMGLLEEEEGTLVNMASQRRTGDQIVAAVQKQLDNFGLVREDHQRRFHDLFIQSCLPKIYENEWATNHESVMRKFGLSVLKQESLIVCPRRYGKTYSVGMYCAAYVMNVPNSEVAIFSTGKRTAGKLMSLIISFLDLIPGFRDCIERKNQEELVLNFGPGDSRKLNCYPGSVASSSPVIVQWVV